MRYLWILVLSCLYTVSFGQEISYADWKALAKKDISLLPEYGNVKKDAGQINADNEFSEAVLKQFKTAKEGADYFIKRGFDFLYSGDLQTAMRRFNQAWLLDKKNENVYWGFGAVYGILGDNDEAITQYDNGLLVNPKSAVILTDKATIYFVQYQQEQQGDVAKLSKL
jgi:tetratricopeptide (TPR) repeat protein